MKRENLILFFELPVDFRHINSLSTQWMWLDGMGTIIPGFLILTILCPLPGNYTCRRLHTKPFKDLDLWCALFAQECMIIMKSRFQLRTTIRMWIVMKYFIMCRAIL